MHENRGIFILPWCTQTQNTLVPFHLTCRLHLITMVGQAIHRGGAVRCRKEPFFGHMHPIWKLPARSHCVEIRQFVVMNVCTCPDCTYVFITLNLEMMAMWRPCTKFEYQKIDFIFAPVNFMTSLVVTKEMDDHGGVFGTFDPSWPTLCLHCTYSQVWNVSTLRRSLLLNLCAPF